MLPPALHALQGALVVYNAHLEVFCGLLARISLLSDMFADARRQADRGLQQQAILGDLNTMAHGIARFSPNHCNDHMRFRCGVGTCRPAAESESSPRRPFHRPAPTPVHHRCVQEHRLG